MTCGWTCFMQTRRATLWATMWCVHKDGSVEKKVSCEVYLSTPTRRLQWVAINCNENNCNKKTFEQKKNCELTSNSMRIAYHHEELGRWKPKIPSCMLVNSSAGEVIIGEKLLVPCCMRRCWPGWIGSSIGSLNEHDFFSSTQRLWISSKPS